MATAKRKATKFPATVYTTVVMKLTSHSRIDKPKMALSILSRSISSGYARLDTLSPKTGKYVSRWKIQANVPEKELQQWRFD